MNFTNDSLYLGGREQIVYESQAEQIVSLLCLFLPALVAVISQLLVIVTIIQTPSLHEPHFNILVTCCAADLLTAMMGSVGVSIIFIMRHQEWMCQGESVGFITSSIILGNIIKLAVIAYERYTFFVQPFKYLSSFTPRRVAIYVTIPYVMSTLWLAVVSVTRGPAFHASALSCYITMNPWLQLALFTFFFAPPSIMSIFTIQRVLKITRTVGPEVAVPSASAVPVHQIRRAVRMLLLMSGTFWLAVLPGHLIHLAVFMSGTSWADLDSRQNRTAAVFVRISTWLYVCFPPAVNPAIYLYSRKDLRTAMMRKLCRNNQVSAN